MYPPSISVKALHRRQRISNTNSTLGTHLNSLWLHRGQRRSVSGFFNAFEELAVEAISFHPEVDLYIIDEIGPLETLSRMFSATAKMLLKNEKVRVLATVAKQGRGFVREVKRLPGTEQMELTESNHEQAEQKIMSLIASSIQLPVEEAV